MKRSIAVFIVALVIAFAGAFPHEANAQTPTPTPKNSVDRVVSIDELAMHSLAVGARRLFIYVNPFEHTEWVGKVDGTLVSGPSSVFANSGNLPTPIAEPSGIVLNAGVKRPPVVPKYDLNTLGGSGSQSACDARLDNQQAIVNCLHQAQDELQSVIAKVGLESDFAGSKARQPYGTYHYAMHAAAEDYASLLQSNIAAPNADDVNVYLAAASVVVGTSKTLSRNIAALPDFPKAEVTRVIGHYDLLAQVLQSCDECLTRPDAKTPKATASPDTKTPNPVPSSNVKAENALKEKRDGLLQQVTAGRNQANTISTYQTKYDSELASLKSANDSFVNKLSVSQFGFFAESNCGGLFSGGREKTVTVSFSATESVALKLVCVSRMFASYGVAFSQSGTHSYTANALPATPTPTPAANATAAPASPTITSVTDNGPGKFRPIFVTMAHFALSERRDIQPNELENGIFGTIGVGATTSTNSQNPIDLDFLYGLSYAKYRSVVITIGQHYGKEQQLAPGYFIGQSLTATANSAIPTVSLYHFRPFFSLTFGKQ